MSGSGTDRTRVGVTREGPVVVLVEPQLGENIGMAARAMGNFGLTRLRLVKPRDGWPNPGAHRTAPARSTVSPAQVSAWQRSATQKQAPSVSRPGSWWMAC